MKTQFAISPDGFHVAYDHSGTGPSLFLLHGGGGSRQEWHSAGYVTRLQDHFKLITLRIDEPRPGKARAVRHIPLFAKSIGLFHYQPGKA